LDRPSWLHVPKFALSLAGEFGKEVLLASQNVLPAAIGKTDFSYKYKNLPAALQGIYSS
jgi:NAD dependent epimerase/dehydratase family enzyme